MIANREQCLDQLSLNDLLAGRLPPERFATALEHVELCPKCAQAAEVASGNGQISWLGKAIRQPRADGFDNEIECQAVVNQLLIQPQPAITLESQKSSLLPIESLGPYRLLKWLGSGGMGAVYLAEHQRLKRLAAIKLLPRDKMLQTGWLDRFNREMTSIAALENPHVVRAIDAGDQGGWHYLVMEYLDGLDVSKVIRRVSDIPIGAACEITRQAALGLAAIHSLGMTHRDIKPSNIFLTRGGTVKLLDLGLVLSGDSPLTADERLTTVGHLMGTIPYMAREQLLDASGVDWRADLYSLGATLCRLISGRAPYGPATNLALTIQAISTTDCPPLKSLRSDVPDKVAELVDRMLSHDIERRPQSAVEVAELLAPFCDSQAPQPLIRAAINCHDEQVDLLNSQQQPAVKLASSSSDKKSRWPLWIAAVLLPLGFLLGILVSVTTDKATLVIESDQPGVSVKVKQGDKVVETLRVEQEPRKLRLYSGKYVVELEGVDSDGLELSDQQIVLTRGDEQVVKILQRSTKTADSNLSLPEPSDKSYQGKSFAYWMYTLEREKDVATIAEAMQAVSLLASTDAEKLAAAQACLRPARELGGFVVAGKPSPNTSFGAPELSSWYMAELSAVYPSFFPEPAMSAIIDELENGTDRSARACILMLCHIVEGNDYSNTKPHDPFSQMANSEAGRDKLKRLDAQLNKFVANPLPTNSTSDQSFGVFAELVIRRRIEILKALESDLTLDSQILEWARKSLAIRSGEFNSGFSSKPPQLNPVAPMDMHTALLVEVVLRNEDHIVAPIAFSLLKENSNTTDGEEAVKVLNKLAQKDPASTAKAVLLHLQNAYQQNANNAEHLSSWAKERSRIATEVFISNPPNTIESVKALAYAAEMKSTTTFTNSDLERSIAALLVRFAREANSEENETKKSAEFALIALSFSQIPIPDEHIQEVFGYLLDHLNSDLKINSRVTDNNYGNQWLYSVIHFSTDSNSEWNDANFVVGLERIAIRNPAVAVEALTSKLTQGNLKKAPMYLIPYESIELVIQSLSATGAFDLADRIPIEQVKELEPVINYLQTEAGKVGIHNLGIAIDLEIGRQVQVDQFKHLNDPDDLSALYALMNVRLIIASFDGNDLKDNQDIRQALRKIVTVWQVNNRHLGLRFMIAFGELEGYKDLDFGSAMNTISTHKHSGEIQQLVRGIYESRPTEYRDFFLRQLLGKTLNMQLSSNSKELWQREVIKPLYDDPVTRTKVVEAINELIKRTSSESESSLKELLPEDYEAGQK